MSDSLQSQGLHPARLPCPSPSPRVCSNSCPLSRWCYWIILSSATPFSFCLQSLPASLFFPMTWIFASGGQNIIKASASVLPMNIQGWFPLGWTGLNSLLFKGLSSLLQHHSSKTSIQHSGLFMVEMSHPYMTTGKTTALNQPFQWIVRVEFL